jgi:hypothetical protein
MLVCFSLIEVCHIMPHAAGMLVMVLTPLWGGAFAAASGRAIFLDCELESLSEKFASDNPILGYERLPT